MSSKQTNSLYATRLLRILLGITAFLLFTHMALQFLNWGVFHQQNGLAYELANRFDLDDEASVPTWFSQILFFAIGIGAMLVAHLQKQVQPKRLWQLIAAGGLLFSIDEVAGLHEFVLQSLHNIFFRDKSPTSLDNAWLLMLPFILIAAFWLVWKISRLLPRRTMLLFVASIATFLFGAIAIDLLTSLTERESFLHQGVMVALEETLELLSTIIIVYAIADFLERYHRSAIHSALHKLRVEL